MRFASALGIDVVMVLAFAVAGLNSHNQQTITVAGVLDTAWPFLIAVGAGSLLARGWRDPYSWPTATTVWLTTLFGGMTLRLIGGDTAAWPFWVVSAVSFAVLLLGWRLVARVVSRRSRVAERSARPDRTA